MEEDVEREEDGGTRKKWLSRWSSFCSACILDWHCVPTVDSKFLSANRV